MLRNLMFGAAVVALVALTDPALAQVVVPDVEIEGPITSVTLVDPPPVSNPNGPRVAIGTIVVMGAEVIVYDNTLLHTPTRTSVDGLEPPLTLNSFKTGKFKGRSQEGFLGGTAIVLGESSGGTIHAREVFSDLFEHVVVGESTGAITVTETEIVGGFEVTGEVIRATINKMVIAPSTDPRLPAAPAINGNGLLIDANRIDQNTLVAAEGYFAGNTLYYHSLEADGARLLNPNRTQVGIVRASCRVRGGGRDELEVRGGFANSPNNTVTIAYHDPTPRNENRFTQVQQVVTGTPDPATSNPVQSAFRADFRNITFASGFCPARVRAIVTNRNGGTTRAEAAVDGR